MAAPSPPGDGGAPAADADGAPPPPAVGPSVPSTFGAYLVAKAGMENVDLDRVKRVVHDASKHSAYFAREQRRAAELDARLATLKLKAAALPPARVAAAQAAADARTAALLASRDVGRTWIVADLDQFFLACHARADPSLDLTRPIAVGGGVVSTASYAARAFGVRSAMPGFIAQKLCPHLHFIDCDFGLYTAAAAEVRAVFGRFDPGFRAMGLDEAALDVTAWCAAQTPPADGAAAAAALRAAVRAETGLAVSCGVACNRMLAKVAADVAKPDGAAVVPRDPAALAAYVAALPVRKVPGVGRVTEATLAALGITTLAHLHAARGVVGCLFSHGTATFLLASSLGCGGAAAVDPDADARRRRQGLSAERTFRATADAGKLESLVGALATRVAERAAGEGLRARTVTLKIKYASFDVKTRAAPVPAAGGGAPPTADAVAAAALRLLRAEAAAAPVRLLGVRLSAFEEAGGGDRGDRQARLEDVLAPRRDGDGDDDDDDDDDEEAGRSRSRSRSRSRERSASLPPPDPRAPAAPATWTCRVCTFAGTPAFSLRCDVCDAVRGSSDVPTAAAPPAPSPHKKNKTNGDSAGTNKLTKFFKAINK